MLMRQASVVRRVGKLLIRIAGKFLVKQYVSTDWVRVVYASVRDISAKIICPTFPQFYELVFVKLKLYLRKQYLHRDRSSGIFISDTLYQIPESLPLHFNPKVSVIVRCHNHARFLRRRLQSIYHQTYSNFEVILLDDASTDESQAILEEYQQLYPNITVCAFNERNSGRVLDQWRHGFTLAQGDLIWIAESDEYCSENLLAELVKYFMNEAVMLAYCEGISVEKEGVEPARNSGCIEDSISESCREPFVVSAHRLINEVWAVTNIVSSVGSAVFRHPGKLELLNNQNWQQMKICGDWIFFLHLIRGGLVAYSPNASNYYRRSQSDIAKNIYSTDIYYQEHEQVAMALVDSYRIEKEVLKHQQYMLESKWRLFRTDYSESSFKKCYDYEKIQEHSLKRKPNLLMASFALTAGGGETFPIKLSNMLKSAGYCITFLNCHKAPTEKGVRRMLRGDIPLLELDTLEKLSSVASDMAIELVHSHHIWVDVCVCYFLEDDPNSQVVVTTHGIYEMTRSTELAQIFPLLKKRVNKFVYLADKNLPVFISNSFEMERFVRIDNAVDIVPITPFPRSELGVPKDAFLICLVSRAIPEKGWQEAIEAVKLAREISQEDIHLLLIGAGPEYERLKFSIKDEFIHLLGFRANVRDYFATSDLGFLPSRYLGESFPLVLIECLHSNRPVLASNLGETKSMISTSAGPAGTVFDLDNWGIPITSVAKNIVEYVKDKEMYLDHLGRVPTAAAKFDPAILLKKYESVYLELNSQTSKSLAVQINQRILQNF